jgi:integrase
MATGQRSGEIIQLTTDAAAQAVFPRANCNSAHNRKTSLGVYDPVGQTVYWSETKAGKAGKTRPHMLPLPRQAVELIRQHVVRQNAYGLLFPHTIDPRKVMTLGSMQKTIRAFLAENPDVPPFSSRDLRRTWKTLTGAAGISKVDRDRLQNHQEKDVSSEHYDRYDYWAEKVKAMKVWEAYLDRILAGKLDPPDQAVSDAAEAIIQSTT